MSYDPRKMTMSKKYENL
eukprot:Gb_15972 [translate_table: standard]